MKKIYIGHKKFQEEGFQAISSIEILDYIVEDAECNLIILDGYLRTVHASQWIAVINQCIKKLRMGGTLKFIDIDFDILCYIYQKENNLNDLQNIFEKPIFSFLTLEGLKQIMQNFSQTTQGGAIMRGIEFDTEFVRIS